MNTDSFISETGPATKMLTVGELNRAIAGLLERNVPLLWVSGEISNLSRVSSGHWYFSLKDKDAQVRCVMFRSRNQNVGWSLREGDRVEARALPGMYVVRGDFQLTVEQLRRAGAGGLYEAFLRLKEKLAAEGLFDPATKRQPPLMPRGIGVVTSLQAAALRDVLTTLARRAPHIPVVVYPAPVQGLDAPPRLVAALQLASRRAVQDGIDVLLLVRGGGSIEDLIAFNDEGVARAVAACTVPVVCGVGHETDFTIADFVADLRAPTPTAAAELASPERARQLTELSLLNGRIERAMQRGLRQSEQRLDDAQRRLKSPRQRVADTVARLDENRRRLRAALASRVAHELQTLRLAQARLRHQRPDDGAPQAALAKLHERLARGLQAGVHDRSARLDVLSAQLRLLDPANALARGYSIVTDPEGRIVRDAASLAPGATLALAFARGAARATVAEIFPAAGQAE